MWQVCLAMLISEGVGQQTQISPFGSVGLASVMRFLPTES
jgi:hypothetical protein